MMLKFDYSARRRDTRKNTSTLMSIKNCVVLTVLSVLLALIILIPTHFMRSYYLKKNALEFENEMQADAPWDDSMYSSPLIDDDALDAVRVNQSELMQSFMNKSVDPCDDFYEYACGNWEKMNPIPKDRWQYSTTTLLDDNLDKELLEILSEPIQVGEEQSATGKAKAYFKNCVDNETLAKRGSEPLLAAIKELGGWPVLDENWSDRNFNWLDLAIKTTSIGSGVIIGYKVDKNPSDPTGYTIFLEQTTLGMINRDNFLKEENAKNLEAYRNLIQSVLQLLKVDEQKAKNTSQEIVDFEVKLANITLPMEAKKTEPFLQPTVKILQRTYQHINWLEYLSGVQKTQISPQQTVVIQLGTKYYRTLNRVLRQTEKRTLANYMVWRVVLTLLRNLDDNFRSAWSTYFTSITGQVESIPLWKLCVNQINYNMGMATSALFVRKYFDESSKNATINVIHSLKRTFDENLAELDWIDQRTKAYASKKAHVMKIAAGYPDWILSDQALNDFYNDIDITEGKHIENYLSITRSYWRRNRRRLFDPYDENGWRMPPTMINALYDTATNRILVLAGILQPPVFHRLYPQSLNYGGIGMFMGHEIIHGFDDRGRKFDVDGNSLNWWRSEAALEFDERKKCFLEQYGELSRQDRSSKSIATISEDLADNGGLRLAYKAYLKWKERNLLHVSAGMETLPNLDLNEDQLFFLSFAQIFCAALRPEAVVESRRYQSHSPNKNRVIGTLQNFEKFSEVYKCPADSPMNPSKKCRLW